jgi:hypothetical protein
MDNGTIHVEDPKKKRRSYVASSEDETPGLDEIDEPKYHAPILAEDEVAKHGVTYEMQAAVEPPPERQGSAFEMGNPPSRPTSRPASIYRDSALYDLQSTPLEDVEEYEPLFDDESKELSKAAPETDRKKPRHQFPSKDVWEDAPTSVHYTAEVSTPDLPLEGKSSKSPEEDTETPAAVFARHQEELAEKEARDSENFKRGDKKQIWAQLPVHIKEEQRPTMAQRFPSRDVWEDAPDSHLQETTVNEPEEADVKPTIPTRPIRKTTDPSTAERPSIPERPKPKQAPSDDSFKTKPVVSDRPKPQIPARPVKASANSETKEPDAAAAKPKPAVPARPMGGKIAALQAGFMSDLNKRLQLGPQAVKKEEPVAQDLTEDKEKAPLSDARKGRARGPQRRAPAKSQSPSPSAAPVAAAKLDAPMLSFSTLSVSWSIDPEEGVLNLQDSSEKQPAIKPEVQPETELQESQEVESEAKPEGGEKKEEEEEEEKEHKSETVQAEPKEASLGSTPVEQTEANSKPIDAEDVSKE